jgi:hypothetical protein
MGSRSDHIKGLEPEARALLDRHGLKGSARDEVCIVAQVISDLKEHSYITESDVKYALCQLWEAELDNYVQNSQN